MAETTRIAWTDATFNPWVGCTKVGPGCDHCYAEAANNRFHDGANWGPGAPRARTSPGNWNKPRTWNRHKAEGTKFFPGRKGEPVPIPLWVFCASQADVFDNEVDPAWRADLWRLIRETPMLRWQLVTKRVGNVAKMLPFGRGKEAPEFYAHVGVIATAVNQTEFDRDGPKLRELKTHYGVRWVGLSIEPQLGPVAIGYRSGEWLDWVISGGESRQGSGQPRPYHIHWADHLAAQCLVSGIPFFVKQLGDAPYSEGRLISERFTGAAKDPDEWPARLRIQQMPRVYGEAT